MSWMLIRALATVAVVSLVVVASAPCASAAEGRVPVAERQQLSQFDRPVKSGQFVTGDWWVVGPVTVARITPPPGPVSGETDLELGLNRWGDTSLKNDTRMRNGSAVVLQCGGRHGYDSRSGSYSPELSLTLPYTLEPNRSLISTVSNTSLPVPNFCHKFMWSSEKTCECVLKAAAVLTCLAEEPPADAFRPPYAGTDKPLYRASDLKTCR